MSYENLAAVYDIFMDNVDYDGWCGCLVRILHGAGIRGGIVCELGCGTGDMTERLARAGYDMIGIDVSEEMLGIAQKKELLRRHPELRDDDSISKPAEDPESPGAGGAPAHVVPKQMPDILYLQQDMRSFELYGTVCAVVSVCDSLNYLTEEEDLLQVFRLVNNYLDPGGLFLFDMNTPACYEAIGEQTIAENRPEGSFIWENIYDPETQCNQYDLTLFLPVTADEGPEQPDRDSLREARDAETDTEYKNRDVLYVKREETHIQRGYTAGTVCRLLREAGLEVVSVTEAYTGQAADEETERILYVTREVQKSICNRSPYQPQIDALKARLRLSSE